MPLISELRSNNRLRIGLTVIVGIVWLYWLLDLSDRNAVLLDQYKQAASQLARFSAQEKQSQWLDRASAAKAALSSAESRLWHNSSLGLAQAELQDWLTQQLTQAKAIRFSVKIAESEIGGSADARNEKSDGVPSDLNRVRAKIEFNGDPQVLNTLLAAMAGAEHQIVVESMIVRQQRAELTITAWYTLQPAEPASQSPAAKPKT